METFGKVVLGAVGTISSYFALKKLVLLGMGLPAQRSALRAAAEAEVKEKKS